MKSSEVKCQECGACCGFPVSEEENGWETEVYLSLNVLEQGELMKWNAGRKMAKDTNQFPHKALKMTVRDARVTDKAKEPWNLCSALKGEVGCSVECKIYQIRPRMCRIVQPGDSTCNWARKNAGLELIEKG